MNVQINVHFNPWAPKYRCFLRYGLYRMVNIMVWYVVWFGLVWYIILVGYNLYHDRNRQK